MRSGIHSTIVLALLIATRWTFAEEVSQPQKSEIPSAAATPTVLPYEQRRSPGHVARLNSSEPSHPSQASRTSSFAIQQDESLRQAAELLEKAGFVEDASRLGQKMNDGEQQRKQALLAEKMRALESLQAEIEELRKPTDNASQVMLSIQVFEVSLTKMRNLGFNFSRVSDATADLNPKFETAKAATTSSTFQFQLLDPKTATGLLQSMHKNGLAKVVAEPTMVGLLGEPFSFRSGGSIPVPLPQAGGTISDKRLEFGTMVDAIVTKGNQGKLKINVRLELSELDAKLNTATVDGQTIPGIRKWSITTGVEVPPGQSLLINGGPPQWRMVSTENKTGKVLEKLNEFQMIVIVTPIFPVDANH
jgi:Flp pilus assembly secretin CpaC